LFPKHPTQFHHQTFGGEGKKIYLCGEICKNGQKMKTTTRTFTPEDWAEHDKFVSLFRAAKQRKHEWQTRMEVFLDEREERARKRRAEVNAFFGD